MSDRDRLPLEYVGIVGGFLGAGASTVLSSLWSVDDESTAELMSSLYAKVLGEGLSPAEALAATQRELRRNPDYGRA